MPWYDGMNISFIIVTYNASDTIRPCLASIDAARIQGTEIEIIVVDNASTDATVEEIRRRGSNISILRNDVNAGFARAVNQGAAQAHGDALFLLNPDAVLGPDVIAKIVDFFSTQPDAAACAPRILHPNGEIQPSVWSFPTLPSVVTEMFLPYAFSSKLLMKRPVARQPIDCASGAALAIRAEVFRELGGLDEGYFMYYEDIDFCLRAKKTGYSIYFLPGATVRHEQGSSSWRDQVSFFRRLYSSKLRYFRLHRPKGFYAIAYLVVVSGLLWKILFYGSGCMALRASFMNLARSHAKALPRVAKTGYRLLIDGSYTEPEQP